MFKQLPDINIENRKVPLLFPLFLVVIIGLIFLSQPLSVLASGPSMVTGPPHQVMLTENTVSPKIPLGPKVRRSIETALRAGRYGASARFVYPEKQTHPLSLKGETGTPSDAVDDLLHPPSRSLGTVTNGFLEAGVEMATDSTLWHFIPAAVARHTNYGTRTLVSMLSKAASDVQKKHDGPKLLIGNLSFKDGGDLPWSVSHNSGRDADVAFYSTYEDGTSVEHNHFIRFNRRAKSSLAGQKVLFDAKRNWTFVRSLLTSDKGQVQWLFLSSPLRRRLLKQAEEEGESAELIARATKVLKQPSDSSPHRDHFHIRLYCDLTEVLEGCRNTGATWDWINDYTTELGSHIEQQEKTLIEGSQTSKLESLRNLKRLGHQPNTSTLITLVSDELTIPDTRTLAIKMLLRSHTPTKTQLLQLLNLPDPNTRSSVIRYVGSGKFPGLVPHLIAQFSQEERPLRDDIRKALSNLTNHSLPVPDGEGPAHIRLHKAWEAWYSNNKSDDWEQWIREGFELKGADFKGRMLRHRSIPILIRYTKRGGHLKLNAHRMLTRITKHGNDQKALSYGAWKRWWRKKYKRYGHRTARL